MNLTRSSAAVGLLAAALAVGGAASAETTTSTYGTLTASDAQLPTANRCAAYPFSYALTPPKGLWDIDVRVTDAQGRRVGGYYENYASNPSATHTFVLCGNTAEPGTYTIAATMHVDTGKPELEAVEMTPVHSVITAPVVTKHKKAGKKRGRRR